MKSVNLNEMRKVEGGTTYTCKCGYKCNSKTKCVTHMVLKHPGAISDALDVLDSLRKLFSIVVGLF